MPTPEFGSQVAAIIPAWNEADVLDQTLASLAAATPPPDRVLVVADHCTDATADVAQKWGAIVLRHDLGPAGKGAALAWAMSQVVPLLAGCAVMAVFDADSRVAPSFFAEIRKAVQRGAQVMQGFVYPVDLPKSTAVILAAYSEVLAQRIDGKLCAWLGGSIRLRGTGMAFDTGLLRELLPNIRTQVEDIELTLLAADRRIQIVSVPSAVVYDPKPLNLTSASRQRARWFRGQFEAFRVHSGIVWHLVLQGPQGWWVLQDVLLKPRSLVWLVLAFAAGLACLFAFGPWSLTALFAVIGLCAAYYLGGLLLVPRSERVLYARALLLAPLYIAMWCLTAVTAWSTGGDWLRARDNHETI